MCLSCVSPLQSVMVYWCSTDVTNKDYPCAAVCVSVLLFPPSLGAVQTKHVTSSGCGMRQTSPGAGCFSIAEICR